MLLTVFCESPSIPDILFNCNCACKETQLYKLIIKIMCLNKLDIMCSQLYDCTLIKDKEIPRFTNSLQKHHLIVFSHNNLFIP